MRCGRHGLCDDPSGFIFWANSCWQQGHKAAEQPSCYIFLQDLKQKNKNQQQSMSKRQTVQKHGPGTVRLELAKAGKHSTFQTSDNSIGSKCMLLCVSLRYLQHYYHSKKGGNFNKSIRRVLALSNTTTFLRKDV